MMSLSSLKYGPTSISIVKDDYFSQPSRPFWKSFERLNLGKDTEEESEPPSPEPILYVPLCVPLKKPSVLFGPLFGPEHMSGLDSLRRVLLPAPNSKDSLRTIFTPDVPVSLIKFTTYMKHFYPYSKDVINSDERPPIYIPSTHGILSYTKSSFMGYYNHIAKDYETETSSHKFFFSDVAAKDLNFDSNGEFMDHMTPFELDVIGLVYLPVVLPINSNVTYLMQFLVIDDIFPYDMNGDDVEMVIDIDRFATGRYWRDERGYIPCVEKLEPKLHMDSEQQLEIIFSGLVKASNESKTNHKIATGCWLATDSLFNLSKIHSVTMDNPRWCGTNLDTIIAILTFDTVMGHVIDMVMNYGVVIKSIRFGIVEEPIFEILERALKAFKDVEMAVYKDVFENFRKFEALGITFGFELVNIEKYPKMHVIKNLALSGERKIYKGTTYSADEFWNAQDCIESFNLPNLWMDGKPVDMKKVEKESAVRDIIEGEYIRLGTLEFLEIKQVRKLQYALPKNPE